ncbi:MAG: carbohydrate porin, partial [Coleofasciculaceae cyanobacterium]
VFDTDVTVNQNFTNLSALNPALVPAGLALLNSAPRIRQLVDSFDNVDPNVSLHLEAFYQMQLTNNISITPGIVWITAPGYNTNNAGLLIGTIRTTFRF